MSVLSECLHLVGFGAVAVGAQQDGGEEGAPLGIGVDDLDPVGIADHDGAGTGEGLDRAAHLLALVLPARAPIRTSGSAGLPMVARSRRAAAASATASSRWSGTNARRMAVHFCPALTVIAVVRPLTNSSNSGVSGTAPGPSTEQFSESASAVKRTAEAATVGWVRSFRAVAAEPVNPSRSCSVRCSSKSPALPAMSCREPSGSSSDCTRSSTSRWVT